MVAILRRMEDRHYVAFCWSIGNGRVMAADTPPVMQRFVEMRVAGGMRGRSGVRQRTKT